MAIRKFKAGIEVDGTVSANTPVTASELTTKNYTDTTFEFDLGNPSSDGQLLSSTTGGTRSWIDPPEGGGSPEFSITQSSHGFSIGDPVAEVGGTWVAATTADDDHTAEGIITTVPDVNTFTATIVGELTLTAHGYTVNAWYYLAANGTFTTTVPSTEGDIIQFVFKTLDANRIYIRVSQPETVAAAAVPGVTVHNDLTGRSASDTHPTSAITGLDTALTGKEDALGNPSSDGDVLSSTIAGARTWITPAAGVTVHSGLTLDDGTNPHGTTKTDVSLGNVDNTSDVNKPVSTLQQAEIDTKEDGLGNPSTNGDVLSSTTGGARSWITPAAGVTVHNSLTGRSVADGHPSDAISNESSATGATVTDALEYNWGRSNVLITSLRYVVKSADFNTDQYNQKYEITGALSVEMAMDASSPVGSYWDVLYNGTGGWTFDWDVGSPALQPDAITGHTYRIVRIDGPGWSMVDLSEISIAAPASLDKFLTSSTAGIKSWGTVEAGMVLNTSGVTGTNVEDALDNLDDDISQIGTGDNYIVKTTDFSVPIYHQNFQVTGSATEISFDSGTPDGVYFDLIYNGTGGWVIDWDDPSPTFMPTLISEHIYRVVRNLGGVWTMKDITEISIAAPGVSGQLLSSTTAGVKTWVTLDAGSVQNSSGVSGASVEDALDNLDDDIAALAGQTVYYSLTANGTSSLAANLSFLGGKGVVTLKVTATMNYSTSSTIGFDLISELQVNYGANAFRRAYICHAGAFVNQYYQTDYILYNAGGLSYNNIQINAKNATSNAPVSMFYMNIFIEATFA